MVLKEGNKIGVSNCKFFWGGEETIKVSAVVKCIT